MRVFSGKLLVSASSCSIAFAARPYLTSTSASAKASVIAGSSFSATGAAATGRAGVLMAGGAGALMAGGAGVAWTGDGSGSGTTGEGVSDPGSSSVVNSPVERGDFVPGADSFTSCSLASDRSGAISIAWVRTALAL